MRHHIDKKLVYFIGAHLLVATIVAVNLFLMLLSYQVANRYFAEDAEDFNGTVQAILAIVSLVPVWAIGEYFVLSRFSIKVKKKTRYQAAIGFNLAFICFAVFFWSWLGIASDHKKEQGDDAFAERNYSSAINYYKQSLYRQENRTDVLFALATIYEELAQYEEAKSFYLKAIYSKDAPMEAYNNLARLYIRGDKGSPEAQRQAYDDALDLILLAEVDFKKKQVSEALFENSQSANEQLGIIEKNKAWIYILLDEYTYAEESLQVAHAELVAATKLQRYPFMACLDAIIHQKKGNKVDGRIAKNLCNEKFATLNALERHFVRDFNLRKSNAI